MTWGGEGYSFLGGGFGGGRLFWMGLFFNKARTFFGHATSYFFGDFLNFNFFCRAHPVLPKRFWIFFGIGQ